MKQAVTSMRSRLLSTRVEVTMHNHVLRQEPYSISEATALVDSLLARTTQIMNSNSNTLHHVVAFSGGIDSSLVAALLQQVAQNNTNHIVQPVLGLSPAVPQEQVDLAHEICNNYLNLDLTTVNTNEGQDETYLANEGRACLACKTHLYDTLQSIAKSVQQQNSNNNALFKLYNGTNADDLLDTTRLGLIAAKNYTVYSPIDQINKTQVRLAARHLGLPHWEMAASPCLRSRLALGVPATKQHLQQMARAERLVKQQLSNFLKTRHNVRVRLLAQQRACIEVDEELMDAAGSIDWKNVFFGKSSDNSSSEDNSNDDSWAFADISVRPFKSGSVAQK